MNSLSVVPMVQQLQHHFLKARNNHNHFDFLLTQNQRFFNFFFSLKYRIPTLQVAVINVEQLYDMLLCHTIFSSNLKGWLLSKNSFAVNVFKMLFITKHSFTKIKTHIGPSSFALLAQNVNYKSCKQNIANTLFMTCHEQITKMCCLLRCQFFSLAVTDGSQCYYRNRLIFLMSQFNRLQNLTVAAHPCQTICTKKTFSKTRSSAVRLLYKTPHTVDLDRQINNQNWKTRMQKRL